MNNSQTCLILGSSSDIGEALAYRFAEHGYHIILAAREVTPYQLILQKDLQIRYPITVQVASFNGDDFNTHDQFFNQLAVIPDLVISVFGYLGNQEKAEHLFDESFKIISSNFTGHVSLLNRYVLRVKGVKPACIIGISSVAGERGRQRNFIYGAAKAGFSTYLSGLRNSMYKYNIHVLTVKPGFVQTKMLGDLKPPTFLTASPERVASDVFKAFKKGRNTVYIYPIWRYIMFIIKLIPEFVFKRLSL